MVGEEVNEYLKDQIDRNFGCLGGWLLARIYVPAGSVIYTDWSAR